MLSPQSPVLAAPASNADLGSIVSGCLQPWSAEGAVAGGSQHGLMTPTPLPSSPLTTTTAPHPTPCHYESLAPRVSTVRSIPGGAGMPGSATSTVLAPHPPNFSVVALESLFFSPTLLPVLPTRDSGALKSNSSPGCYRSPVISAA